MKVIQLNPIRETKEEYDRIEKKIKELFRSQVYLPLIVELSAPRNLLENSLEDLRQAILKGKIYFHAGQFTGNFNSTISKELKALGAVWDKNASAFRILKSKLPDEIKTAISVSFDRFQKTAKKMEQKLSEIVPDEIAEKLKIENIFDTTLYKVENEFKKSIKNITVAPELTVEMRARIAKEYTENMKLYIKGWLKEEIVELRKRIQAHAFDGYRYEALIGEIQKSYGVSQRKAKFLARQETALLITKFKEVRYQDAGVNHYRWKCVVGTQAHPVRPRHRQLNDESVKGKIFRFDDPPVVTEVGEPTRKANPGADFNCRCVALPVVNR